MYAVRNSAAQTSGRRPCSRVHSRRMRSRRTPVGAAGVPLVGRGGQAGGRTPHKQGLARRRPAGRRRPSAVRPTRRPTRRADCVRNAPAGLDAKPLVRILYLGGVTPAHPCAYPGLRPDLRRIPDRFVSACHSGCSTTVDARSSTSPTQLTPQLLVLGKQLPDRLLELSQPLLEHSDRFSAQPRQRIEILIGPVAAARARARIMPTCSPISPATRPQPGEQLLDLAANPGAFVIEYGLQTLCSRPVASVNGASLPELVTTVLPVGIEEAGQVIGSDVPVGAVV